MPWYYANDNRRTGPVNDSEFARLAREKVIRAETLVWRHGMPDWKTFAEVEPTLPPEMPPELPAVEASGTEVFVEGAAGAFIVPVRLAYAGFWVRGAAKLVDWALLWALSRGLVVAFGMGELNPMDVLEMSPEALGPLVARLLLLVFLDSAMRLGFYWYFLKRHGATPGKLMFGLQVVSTRGGPLTNGQIVARYFSEVLAKYFTLGIGYTVAAFDAEKRAMQDHFCDTRVVYRRRD